MVVLVVPEVDRNPELKLEIIVNHKYQVGEWRKSKLEKSKERKNFYQAAYKESLKDFKSLRRPWDRSLLLKVSERVNRMDE